MSTNPTAGVWALVSGLPPGRRERRSVLMLTAYIDDSQSERTPPIFVLGGYLASAATWADFTTEWDRELKTGRQLNRFKLKEARRDPPNGEFWGMTREQADARVARFRAIIEKFNLREFGVGFRIDEYRHAYRRFAKPQNNPYYFATAFLMAELGRNIEKFQLPREPLDIVFDNQVMEQARVLEGWQWAVQNSKNPDPPDLLSAVLKNSPSWRDDEDVLPLQAADMHATWVRMLFEAGRAGADAPAIPGRTRILRGVLFTFTAQELQERADELERIMIGAGVKPLPSR